MLSILTLPKAGVPSREMKPDELPPLLPIHERSPGALSGSHRSRSSVALEDTICLPSPDHRGLPEPAMSGPSSSLRWFMSSWSFHAVLGTRYTGNHRDSLLSNGTLPHQPLRILIAPPSPPSGSACTRRHDLMQRGADFVLYAVADAVVDTFLRW